jgi:hypothetical protein
VSELLEAVRQYHPDTQCWQFVEAGRTGRPQLAPIPDESMPAEAPAAQRHEPWAVADEAAAGPGPAPAPRSRDVKPPVPAAAVVSEQELAMLLGPWPAQESVAND